MTVNEELQGMVQNALAQGKAELASALQVAQAHVAAEKKTLMGTIEGELTKISNDAQAAWARLKSHL